MNYSVYTDTDWLYPDTPADNTRAAQAVCVDAPLGGHAGFQILADPFPGACPLSVTMVWDNGYGPDCSVYELLPVRVNENTHPSLMTTTDYETCRSFVTRQAPFSVYDALRPYDGQLTGSRPAFYICLEAPPEYGAESYSGHLVLEGGGQRCAIPVTCQVHGCRIPSPAKARLGMLNFFDYEGITRQHGPQMYSPAYWELYRKYVRMQLRMRCTHIMLPGGAPVYRDGKLSGFDFTAACQAGRIAAAEGAPYLCGGPVAHWKEWTDPEYYLSWNGSRGVTTQEGYLELSAYFKAWAALAEENGWKDRLVQSLADEPQVHNAATYRILACIFRRFLPGVPIVDAVEATDLGGGLDIWVPKQDTYEKYREEYDRLKDAGETFWFYTCAFPAGPVMNRSMDLPLTVSRAVLWMGALYDLCGFLHWGFNYYIGDDIWNSACCPHKGALLPAGDAHIVYPGPDGPYPSMRYEAQRAGAEDYELLWLLKENDREKADAIIRKVCRSFREYTSEGAVLLKARKELLNAVCS